MTWETVVGLEVHVQLQTRSKIFSGASTAYGAAPNTQACAIDIALPGVLPVMNEDAVRLAVKFGLAIHAKINQHSIFARKNYFYPDLPKGYQISQYELPIVGAGELEIPLDEGMKTIRITRAHLEEDAGKSLHEDFHGQTGIDLNRAGTPLLEIVSEPDMRSAKEAVTYLRQLHNLVRFLDISDGNMQEGSFRCDANVSVRRASDETLGTRTELKNINSFRFVERAIEFEVERQIEVLEDGGRVIQETRLYDPERDETRPMRGKEEAHDYRYFPDPDLPPLVVTDALIDSIRRAMPELPAERRSRFVRDFGLSATDADFLTASREIADYFETATRAADGDGRSAANWMTGDWASALNRDRVEFDAIKVSPESLGALIGRINDGTISGKIAKAVFDILWREGGEPDHIIEAQGLTQISDTEVLTKAVEQVLINCETQAQQYREGNEKVLGYLVGQVMKATAGKANPKAVNELLREKLNE